MNQSVNGEKDTRGVLFIIAFKKKNREYLYVDLSDNQFFLFKNDYLILLTNSTPLQWIEDKNTILTDIYGDSKKLLMALVTVFVN